jgi:hypothetical protein
MRVTKRNEPLYVDLSELTEDQVAGIECFLRRKRKIGKVKIVNETLYVSMNQNNQLLALLPFSDGSEKDRLYEYLRNILREHVQQDGRFNSIPKYHAGQQVIIFGDA